MINRKTVAESMRRRQGLRAWAAKRFRRTIDSSHALGVAPNRIAQDFNAKRPDEKWAGAITYSRTAQGWLYLSDVMDLCTRKVTGWRTRLRIDSILACTVLQAAIARRGEPCGVIMHSDGGGVYCGWRHRDLIRRYGLLVNISGWGNCYDNAVMESFFHSLKVENIHGEPLAHAAVLCRQLFEYIEMEYNRTNRYSALEYVSPEVFAPQIAT